MAEPKKDLDNGEPHRRKEKRKSRADPVVETRQRSSTRWRDKTSGFGKDLNLRFWPAVERWPATSRMMSPVGERGKRLDLKTSDLLSSDTHCSEIRQLIEADEKLQKYLGWKPRNVQNERGAWGRLKPCGSSKDSRSESFGGGVRMRSWNGLALPGYCRKRRKMRTSGGV